MSGGDGLALTEPKTLQTTKCSTTLDYLIFLPSSLHNLWYRFLPDGSNTFFGTENDKKVHVTLP